MRKVKINGADSDWDIPATVEKFVAVNKFGFIQAKNLFQKL